MNRREVLIGLAASGLTACVSNPRNTLRALTTAEVHLHDTPTGPKLRSDFAGLSFESALLADPQVFTPSNRSLISLLQRLSPQSALRLGGNSSEFGFWRPNAGPVPAPLKFPITPADIDRLAGFVEASGWRVIYGLNFGHGDPARAADEAAYVAQRLGDRLEALQIGNEPDLYYRNHLRTAGYDFADFIAEWKTYANAIRARVPQVQLAGPDLAYRPDWIEAFGQAAGDQVSFFSDHYYPTGPASDPEIELATLLNSELKPDNPLRDARQRLQRFGKPLRVTECNSVYSGGKPGVSDTLGAALWASQLCFQQSREGLGGICFHGGTGGPYTPLARSPQTGEWTPRPLYYGLLLFAQAAPATLIDAQIKTSNLRLRGHAAITDDGRYQLALINQSVSLPMDARVYAPRGLKQGSLLRLTGSTLYTTEGITLGGSAVGSDGSWQPRPEPVSVDTGVAYVTVSPGGAVLVTLD